MATSQAVALSAFRIEGNPYVTKLGKGEIRDYTKDGIAGVEGKYLTLLSQKVFLREGIYLDLICPDNNGVITVEEGAEECDREISKRLWVIKKYDGSTHQSREVGFVEKVFYECIYYDDKADKVRLARGWLVRGERPFSGNPRAYLSV